MDPDDRQADLLIFERRYKDLSIEEQGERSYDNDYFRGMNKRTYN